MKYHKRFKRFHPQTVAYTKTLMSGWAGLSDTEKWVEMDSWLFFVSEVYGMRKPVLAMDDGAGYGLYKVSRNQINMAKPSIVTLLHEFRHAMQVQGASMVDRDHEIDARAWSLSLYYKVAPRTFERLVRERAILHITPEDLVAA